MSFGLNYPTSTKQLLSLIKQIKGEYNICSSLVDDPTRITSGMDRKKFSIPSQKMFT